MRDGPDRSLARASAHSVFGGAGEESDSSANALAPTVNYTYFGLSDRLKSIETTVPGGHGEFAIYSSDLQFGYVGGAVVSTQTNVADSVANSYDIDFDDQGRLHRWAVTIGSDRPTLPDGEFDSPAFPTTDGTVSLRYDDDW